MGKSIVMEYLAKPTDIYHLVDDAFLNGYSEKQRLFMLIIYYEKYKDYCGKNNFTPDSMDTFLKNARRKKIKIIQVCCPYCGNVDLHIQQLKVSDLSKMGYCTVCGRKSTAEFIFLQLSAFLRLEEVHRAGLKTLGEKYEREAIKILSYDVYHMELIELTSILEKTLRDFFIEMGFLKYKNHNASYIENVIRKSTGNDFMLWDKANEHYKKALDINFKDIISEECRNNISDLVNIRNVVVHNNGMIDDRFKKTATYKRIPDAISGNLIFVTESMIAEYLGSVLELISAVESEFNTMFKQEMHGLIANFYFNL